MHAHGRNHIAFCFLCLLYLHISACKSGNQDPIGTDTVSSSPVDTLLSEALHHVSTNGSMAGMLLRQARPEIAGSASPGQLAKYHQVKGRLFYYLDESDSSILHLDSALQIYNSLPHGKEKARTHSFLASSLALAGEYPASLDHWFSAIDLFQKAGDTEELAGAYNSLARLYIHQKQYEQARMYTEKSKNLVKDTLDLLYANILATEGSIHQFRGEISQAENMHRRAYQIRLHCANIRHIASSLVQLAEIEVLNEDYVSAKKHLLETIDIYNELNEKTGMFNALHSLSRVELKAGNIRNAEAYARETLKMAEEMQNINHRSTAELNLYKVYRQEGRFSEAIRHFENHHAFQSEIFSIGKSRQLADIEHRYALEGKEKDNRILIQQNQLRKHQIWLLSSFSATLLILLITLMIYTRMKGKAGLQRQQVMHAEKKLAEARNQALESEKKLLENTLEMKNRELTGKTIELLRQIETIQSLVEKIETIRDPETRAGLNSILAELNAATRENVWEEFHTAFQNVNQEFYDRLFERCPDLSSTEIKTAALLKLNLSTKEIAALCYKSESAVKTARHRLRRKLQLPGDENLLNYLMKI